MPFNPYKCQICESYDLKLISDQFESEASINMIDRARNNTLRAGDEECKALASFHDDIWMGDPRTSPTKAMDMSMFRRLYIAGTLELYERFQSGFTLSLIKHKWQRLEGKLDLLDLERELRTEKKYFERRLSSDVVLLLAMDFTANTDSQRPGEVFWQPHLHGVIFNATDGDLQAIRARYPAKPQKTVFRPCKIEDLKNPIHQLSYILKINYKRWKPTYDRTHPEERKPPLLAHQLRELLLFLDQFELTDLVLMHGVRRQGCELKIT